ncbi:MAG: aspartate/glutamate racemase family protein [Comamonadaceae bacterium]|jgi:allantoin racemase|nr:aspartate/glutamate racemase family protein [Comamonadaceae bacterium]
MFSSPAKKLLLINPNTSASTTERLTQTLSPLLPPGWHLHAQTARFGASYISCEASHAVAAHAALEVWCEHLHSGMEPPAAVLLGCFGDPGLFALRECSACPVTGLAEASFIEAAALGPFAIVTGGQRWRPMLERLAQSLGFGDRLLHIETVAPSGAEMLADPDMALRCLAQACQAAALPGVRSIILGGAGLAGYAQALHGRVSLPLIDSAQAGLRVLIHGLAEPARRAHNGFYAQWSNVQLELGS